MYSAVKKINSKGGGKYSSRSVYLYDNTGRLFQRVEFTPPKVINQNRRTGEIKGSRRMKTTDDEFQRAISSRLLSTLDMKRLAQKERQKTYRIAKKFVKEYERERLKEQWENMTPVEKADALMTKAASIKGRYVGLKEKQFEEDKHKHLQRAIEPLRIKGEEAFNAAMEIVNSLSDEEKELFWQKQERNRGATQFTDLVTKKDYNRKLLSAQLSSEISEKPTSPHIDNFEEEEKTTEMTEMTEMETDNQKASSSPSPSPSKTTTGDIQQQDEQTEDNMEIE